MTTTGNINANKVHEDVQSYVRGKKIDSLVANIIENVMKYRPTHIATFIIDYLFRNYTEDAKESLGTNAVFNASHRTFERIPVNSYTLEGYNVTINSDIQGDLEKYLREKNLHPIMTSLVERLLISEAPNPYASMVEYLCDDYPDQGLLALELLNPQKNTALVSAAKTIASLVKTIDANSDSDEDEGGDTFDAEDKEEETPKPPPVQVPAKKTNRRMSVSSESLDPNKLKEEISKITIVPKDTAVMQTLYQVVSKSTMLKRMLDPEERTLIVKAFAGPVYMNPGEDIIRQGDIGDVFYLLETGTVDVFVKKDGQELKVHTYRDGDAFGQLALMYNAPRAATCRAVSEVKLWTLDRNAFKIIIAGASLRKREMYLAFLAQVPILQSLSEHEKLVLADSLIEEKFPDNAIICQEGQYGNDFYIILDGKVNCFQKNKDSAGEKLVLSLSTGQYFGEIALLTSKPRQATVRADGDVKVLIIDRATFTRVFGPLEQMLKRNMELYNRYSNTQNL